MCTVDTQIANGRIIMKRIHSAIVLSTLLLSSSTLLAAEKDCLLRGTVEHGTTTDGSTQVKINSVSRYNEESRCSMKRGQKMEFKLPQDPRIEKAPSGSEVEYRYRQDDNGASNAELISIDA